MYINILRQNIEHFSKLEAEIDTLTKKLKNNIIKSILGIGEKIAATIISEIGEIDRFNVPKKLVVFASVDLVYSNQVCLQPLRIVLQNKDLIIKGNFALQSLNPPTF